MEVFGFWFLVFSHNNGVVFAQQISHLEISRALQKVMQDWLSCSKRTGCGGYP